MTKDRKILLDTETTGFYHRKDDRIIEIACLELFEDSVIGEKFHFYINPQRTIPEASSKVHGITDEKVAESPVFADIAKNFVKFVGSCKIIAHNSEFDRGFLNSELLKVGEAELPFEQFIDTLTLARKKFGHKNNTLDDLCRRFNIDLSSRRDYHGALVDTALLADIYRNLIAEQKSIFHEDKELQNIQYGSVDFEYREFPLSQKVEREHLDFLNTLKNPIWLETLEK